MNKEGVNTINYLEDYGNKVYKCFLKERLIDKSKTIFEPLKKVNIKAFKSKSTKSMHVIKDKYTDEQLFSKLFIGCQIR